MALDENMINSLKDVMGENLPIILENYIETSKELVDDVQDSFQKQDWDRLNRAAHPLKSSSHQLGAMGLSRCAAEIEHLAAEENTENLEQLVQQCSTLYAEAVIDIQNLLNE